MSQSSLDLNTAVKNIESFEFEPIKGYPMLNWKGKRPFRSTHFYPAQHKETHGEDVNGWLNQIFWGDNLQVMSHLLKKFRGQIKLIYIDPPYDSKADYKKSVKVKGKSVGNAYTAFEEKQYSDIWSNDEYLQFMYERIILLRELLSETGSIYLQCDTHRGHYLKCIMDEVFGAENEINTISWQRSHAHGDTGQGAKHFGRATDYILMYAKSPDFTFNPQYLPYTKEVIARDYKYTDEKMGEKYRLTPVDGPGGAAKGNPFYEFLGVSGYYRYSKSKMQDLFDAGEIVLSSTGKTLQRKKFLKDAKGTPVMDVWTDASRISPTSSERLDYPTQKPESLLERVIKTSSNYGDIVFDCFMGSGTTQAVALKLGRKFIGADINLGSIQTTTKRLIKIAQESSKELLNIDKHIYTGFSVYNVNHYDIFRNPIQAKELLIEALEVQPLPAGNVFDGEQDGYMVKIMPVNRIATKADLRELVMNIDQKEWMRRREEIGPNRAIEHIRLVCMGHEPDLAAELQRELSDFKLKVEVVDILRDRADLEFKRDAEAKITRQGDKLVIEKFYPLNLLQKLSLQKEKADNWRDLVESVMIDFNYDGAVLQPTVVDIPATAAELVRGEYSIPATAGTIRVKITDLLSESLEVTLPAHG